MEYTNKTTGYYRYTLCLPIFVKKASQKIKFHFFSKKHSFFFFNFLIFLTLKIFWYFTKNLIRAEKTFLRNNTIWYACYIKFFTFSDFEEVQIFLEKLIFFFQKKPKFNVLRNLTISVVFYGEVGINWWKKNHVQKRERTSVMWTQLADIGWKNAPFEWKILLSYFELCGAKY